MQITDTTNEKTANSGGYLLPYWRIICNDKNNKGKLSIFERSTKTNSPTSHAEATSNPSLGNSFMYIETSQNISVSNNIFVSFERTDINQKTNIILYYNRF